MHCVHVLGQYVHEERKKDAKLAHESGWHLSKQGNQIPITCDKASNFQLLKAQLKGGTKALSFYNFFVRLPPRYQVRNDLETENYFSKNYLKKADLYSHYCYLFFFDTKMPIDKLIVQMQKKLRKLLMFKTGQGYNDQGELIEPKILYPDTGWSWIDVRLGIWVSGLLGIWASGHLGFWALGNLGFWTSGHLGFWTYGHLGFWASGHLGIWDSGHLGIWASGHLGF